MKMKKLALVAAMALLLMLASFSPSPAIGAEESTHFLGDPKTDLAAARKQVEAARQKRLEWELLTSLGAYDQIGNKSDRWNAAVREALTLNAQTLAGITGIDERLPRTKKALVAALAAGCDDPFVIYTGLRAGFLPPGSDVAAVAKLYADAAARLEESRYPEIRKAYATLRAAEKAAAVSDENPEVARWLGQLQQHLTALFQDSTADRQSTWELWDQNVDPLVRKVPAGRRQIFEPLAKLFTDPKAKILGDEVSAGLLVGSFWIDYAWEARSTKWASEVTDEGWRLMSDRLDKAQTALEAAWAKDPTEAPIAISMMTVELGQGQGLARLEQWFRRAMDANPDSYAACLQKMTYLEPKWHGSRDQVLSFGRECLATGNWPARLPFILLAAHNELARYAEDHDAYWQQPEVWADVQKLYENCLRANPDRIGDRSCYGLYAYRCGQWKLAHSIFTALGPNIDLVMMRLTPAEYETIRADAEARAK